MDSIWAACLANLGICKHVRGSGSVTILALTDKHMYGRVSSDEECQVVRLFAFAFNQGTCAFGSQSSFQLGISPLES